MGNFLKVLIWAAVFSASVYAVVNFVSYEPGPAMRTADTLQPSWPTISESAFVVLLKDYAARYSAAATALIAGSLRVERGKVLCQSLPPDLTISNWMGTVSRLSSTNDGQGILVIRISSEIVLTTELLGFSDRGKTLIPPNSELYRQALALREAQTIRFSGSFIPDPIDCLKENSLTVWGGMTDPEFLFRFSAVRPAE